MGSPFKRMTCWKGYVAKGKKKSPSGKNKNPAWIHVSYISVDKNRNRKLLAEKEFGKTTYKIIK